MAVPGTFTSGQVLTAAEMNDLPAGIVGSDVVTSNVSMTTSPATSHTVTFTAISGRKYLAVFSGFFEGNNTSGAIYRAYMYQDATRIIAGSIDTYTTSVSQSTSYMVEVPNTTGSTTLTVELSMSTGTGQLNASATNRSTLVVLDVGT